MAQQRPLTPQVTDLRLQFFPAPVSPLVETQDRTRLIQMPVEPIVDQFDRGPYLVQCNCACK
jgi:hypothetical protein